ncbi:MAG TPA: cysteine--tRNA ligase, partial [Crocinitomicaceae bacterium]|nr:cysteine--tRNA ligase [Crocinitomicaceae bacterium]
NSPILVARLFEVVKYINSVNDKKATITTQDKEILQKAVHAFVFDILGLNFKEEQGGEKLNDVMKLVIDLRHDARAKKDFATSDKIRDYLGELGITIKDSKDGTSWS